MGTDETQAEPEREYDVEPQRRHMVSIVALQGFMVSVPARQVLQGVQINVPLVVVIRFPS